MKNLVRALAAFTLVSPAVAFAAAKSLRELAATIVEVLNEGTALLVLAGFVIYLLGVAGSIWKSDEGKKNTTTFFLWGVLTLFVMVSIWGILHILQDTLFSSSPYDPTYGSPRPQQDYVGAPYFE